jgi:thiol-disulfide isomerase/thioredoxin
MSSPLSTLMALATTPSIAAPPEPVTFQDAGVDALRAAGFRPVETAPIPLDLPDLEGKPRSLEEYRGRWVMVSFFATWCGPCAAELPALTTLHQALAPGLEVLGVSVDDDVRLVAPFLQRRGGGFPAWIDLGGRTTARWKATALPTTWLVDPSGAPVGAATGARDWTRSIEPLRLVIGAAAAPPPPPVAPPVVTVTGPDRAYANTPFTVVIEVEPRDDLRVLGPSWVPIPGIFIHHLAADAPDADGTRRWIMELETAQPGAWSVDPIPVRYLSTSGGVPQTVEVAGVSVTVEAGAAPQPGPSPLVYGALGVSGLVVVGAAGWALRGRGAPPPPATTPSLHGRVAAARALRQRGDTLGWAVELRAVALSRSLDPKPYDDLIERVRFAGHVPDSMHAEDLERELTRGAPPEEPT